MNPKNLFRRSSGALDLSSPSRFAFRLLFALCLALAAPLMTGCGAWENVQVVNDPFLGPTRGFMMYLNYGNNGVSVKEAKGTYTIQVMVVEQGDSSAVAAVGDKTEFLVGTEVVTLENTAEARPVANVLGSMVITQWQLTFKLDAKEAARFAVAPLNAIKAHVGSQEYQFPLDATKAAKFQANLALMTSTPVGATVETAKAK